MRKKLFWFCNYLKYIFIGIFAPEKMEKETQTITNESTIKIARLRNSITVHIRNEEYEKAAKCQNLLNKYVEAIENIKKASK